MLSYVCPVAASEVGFTGWNMESGGLAKKIRDGGLVGFGEEGEKVVEVKRAR